MVEAMAVSIGGKAVSLLFDQVVELTKIAVNCNKFCRELDALFQVLQPIVDHAVRQISQSNFDNASKIPRSAVHGWLAELEGTLKRALVEVNTCIQQQADLNPLSRRKTGKRILDVTESVKKLLQQAGLVGLDVALSESSRAQKMEKRTEESHEMMNDINRAIRRIEFATVTQKSLEKAQTRSSAEVIASDIKSALDHFLELSLQPSDNMRRVDTGASSSSSCPLESTENEDAHQLTDIKEVPRHLFGLDKLVMGLQQSITSSSTDAEPRCVGVWGMGGAGKTLLARIAYNSREVRENFEVDKLIWLTVSQNPNVKGLYDSLCKQLRRPPMDFPQLDEYKTRLYNMFLKMRVFLVLDDVWNKEVLEQLDLAKGRGSVTLVTTRKQPVLEQAGVKVEDEVKVGCLSQEDSMKLFCVHAFPRVLSNIPCQLQEVVELVAEECKGLPLALKVIGGSMVGKRRCEEWELQLNRLRDSSKLPEVDEKALFGRLKLSYDNLDKHSTEGECFLGFAAFPEDDEVQMEELFKTWKAQGALVPTYMGEQPIQLAYCLVGLLIGRSMIEVVENSYACKIHDVMRDLALRIIKDRSPITCLYRPGKKLVEFPRDWIQTDERQRCEVRNVSLMNNDLTTLNGVTFSAPRLQLLLLGGNRLEAMPKKFLKGIENLKVLDLSCCMLKFLPGEIGNLRKLTHLYLRQCHELKTLPRDIGNLRELTHLDVTKCGKLNSLPKEIGKLTQLTYLNLCWCATLKKLPKSMVGLTSLQYLNLYSPNSYSIWDKRSRNDQAFAAADMCKLTCCKRSRNDQAFAAADICKLTTLTTLHISGAPGEMLGCDQLSELVTKLEKLIPLTN